MLDFSVACGAATIRGTEVGSGRAVVFVHAGVADRRSWFPVMEDLAADGMRCLAYDQRGYGDTEAPDEGFAHRDDLACVLGGRGVERAILVGASRGGQVALDFALAAPERVEALLLVGSAPGDAPFPPPPDAITSLSRDIEEAEARGDLEKVNEIEARIWLDGPLAPAGRVAAPLRDLFLDMNGRAIRAGFGGRATSFAPTWDALPSVALRVSVVVGDLDMPGLVAAAQATAARIPGAAFRTLAGTAHLPMLEMPSVIADEVRAVAARA